MNKKPYCCFIGCNKDATFEIDAETYHNTHSCNEHIEDLKDDRYENIITPIE